MQQGSFQPPVVPTPPDGPSHESPDSGDQALGFAAEPVQEKYNTEYLTTNLVKSRRNMQMMVGVGVAAVLAGIVMWFLLIPAAPPTTDTNANGQTVEKSVAGKPDTAAVKDD